MLYFTSTWGRRFSTYWNEFGTLIELAYVINFAKFGVDRSQGWGLVSSQIIGFCLY